MRINKVMLPLQNKQTAVVIAAAGNSSRMGDIDKQFASLCGIPVILRSAKAFDDIPYITEIIVVASEKNLDSVSALIENACLKKPTKVVCGGENRTNSVINGINAVSLDCSLVAVHDGARPLVSKDDIESVIELAKKTGAAILASKVKDTVKQAVGGKVILTPHRDSLYLAGTPQVFSVEMYRSIIKSGINGSYSDDSLIFEKSAIPVSIAEGGNNNIKITTQEDMVIAESLLEMEHDMRIGTGYDVHKFAQNRRLILGGVDIPHSAGLLGHSDADVLVHSIMDSLLGAAALGDIGKLFPDSDNRFKDADSLHLLGEVMKLLKEHGYSIGNIDSVIIAEKPKIADHIHKIRQNIAAVCETNIENISVKATTEEGLGLAGEGIGAKSVCIIKKSCNEIRKVL